MLAFLVSDSSLKDKRIALGNSKQRLCLKDPKTIGMLNVTLKAFYFEIYQKTQHKTFLS